MRELEITKAEYFREHAELLARVARCLQRDDKKRSTLLSMSYHFETLAEAAETETRSADSRMRKSDADPTPRDRIRIRGTP